MATTQGRRVSWTRLGDRTRLMLQRLNDCVLLSEHDLCALVWPEAVSRQSRFAQLTRWRAEEYIKYVPTGDETCYQLGFRGVRLLREAGFHRIAPTRPIAERSRAGLLLANHFGAALNAAVFNEVSVSGCGWAIRPFTGATARADGIAAIEYSINSQPTMRARADGYAPELLGATYTPPPGHAVQRFVVEIDSGTEDYALLRQRAANWRAVWDQTLWPSATHTVFLWITTGGMARLEALWRAWTQHALLPAFFTTIETLTLGVDHAWQPWQPHQILPDGRTVWVWRDTHGRPRSLRPWDINEPTWRYEAPAAITQSSLVRSIKAWDAPNVHLGPL